MEVYLEYHNEDKNSHKFWRAQIRGANVFVRWGRIGASGQGQTKIFSSESAARDFYEDMVSKKRKKGYS